MKGLSNHHMAWNRAAGAVVIAVVALVSGCGGSGAMAPSEPPTAGTTITITPSGVSPKNLLVSAGSQVTFVNNDSRSHDMQSDPHPEHTDCPALASVGFLTPGQSRQTGNLNVLRVCGYHDHDDAGNSKWQGKITTQ